MNLDVLNAIHDCQTVTLVLFEVYVMEGDIQILVYGGEVVVDDIHLSVIEMEEEDGVVDHIRLLVVLEVAHIRVSRIVKRVVGDHIDH